MVSVILLVSVVGCFKGHEEFLGGEDGEKFSGVKEVRCLLNKRIVIFNETSNILITFTLVYHTREIT